jgi:hypothetical protein
VHVAAHQDVGQGVAHLFADAKQADAAAFGGFDFAVLIYFIRNLWIEWRPKIDEWITSHISANHRQMIQDLGHEAFAYAETVYRDKNGADKLHEALAYFQAHMDKCGLTNLTYDTIRAAIERAWLQDKSTRTSEVTATIATE